MRSQERLRSIERTKPASASPRSRRQGASSRSPGRRSGSPRPPRGSVTGMSERRVALVTGASSGIGAATLRTLATAGFEVFGAARRIERVEEVTGEIGGRALRLDVTDPESVSEVAEALPDVSVLVNSAGGALGLEPVAEADEEKWRQMYETNVLGVVRMTKALLPALE